MDYLAPSINVENKKSLQKLTQIVSFEFMWGDESHNTFIYLDYQKLNRLKAWQTFVKSIWTCFTPSDFKHQLVSTFFNYHRFDGSQMACFSQTYTG